MDLVHLAIFIGSVEAIMIGVFVYQVNVVYKEDKYFYRSIGKWQEK